MDDQQQEIKSNDNLQYEQWIANGKLEVIERDFKEAHLSLKTALGLVEDKYQAYIEIANANIICLNCHGANQYLIKALEYANNLIDRYLELAKLFDLIYSFQISLYIHGLIKDFSPNYDHEIPKSYEDYKSIVLEYFINDLAQYAEKPIEKFLQLSNNKLETLMYLIKITLSYYSENLEIVETYCNQALLLQQDNYDTQLRIAELLKEYSLELSIKYYEGAKDLKPERFFAQIQIGSVLIKYQKFQEALQYFRSQQIPEQKQVYIDLGLLLLKSEETQEDGLEYLLKGIELSENKFDTLVQLANLQDVDGRKVQKLLLQKALELRENDQHVLEQLGKIDSKSKPKQLFSIQKHGDAIRFIQNVQIDENHQAKDQIKKIEESNTGKLKYDQILQE